MKSHGLLVSDVRVFSRENPNFPVSEGKSSGREGDNKVSPGQPRPLELTMAVSSQRLENGEKANTFTNTKTVYKIIT